MTSATTPSRDALGSPSAKGGVMDRAHQHMTTDEHVAYLRELPTALRDEFIALADELQLDPAERAVMTETVERAVGRVETAIAERLSRPR